MRVTSVVFAAVALVTLGACSGRRATEGDCQAILDRLVDIELREEGYMDPALSERWHATARTRFAAELAACRERRLPEGALACVARATTAEEVAHRCLR
jgi:hypothetical protein